MFVDGAGFVIRIPQDLRPAAARPVTLPCILRISSKLRVGGDSGQSRQRLRDARPSIPGRHRIAPGADA